MEAAQEATQAVTFMLGEETYGAPIAQVQEIVAWSPPIRIPHAPRWIEGVIDLRGTLVPVIDLRQRFALSPSPVLPTRCVIVAQVADQPIGLLVDAVKEVAFVQTVDPLPAAAKTAQSAFLSGMARIRKGAPPVLLVDLERLLSDDDWLMLRTV